MEIDLKFQHPWIQQKKKEKIPPKSRKDSSKIHNYAKSFTSKYNNLITGII